MPQRTIQQAFDVAIEHHQANRLQEAEPLYREILAQQPNHGEALHYLGLLAHQVGRGEIAVELIRRAIALKPDYPQAHSNLGMALRSNGKPDQAIAAYRQALALRPDYAEAHNNLGNVLKDIGELDQAIVSYRRALALSPKFSVAHSNLVFSMNYHPGFDARAIAAELKLWNHQHAEPLKGFIQPRSTGSGQAHPNDRDPDRRLRIGYVSADFWSHASALFLLPLLEHHDPKQVEIFCYAQNLHPDATTRRMQQHASQWRSTVGLSDDQLAAQIRQDRIDILIDLKLHSENNRLLVFARKPAPVQATWLGYPGSTGLDTIDYRFSDPYLDPPGMDESVYTEQTIRLPDTFWCYDPLEGREIAVNPLPTIASGIVTFGCLNNFCKINRGILELWGKVLGQVEGSRLILLANPGSHRQRTAQFLAEHGVDPKRLEFLDRRSRQRYLELYHRIDVGLDTFSCNGHTTSLDSFWMGVPVVTLAGQTPMSRAGWCQLSNLGLCELAGHAPKQFVRIAVELAHDLPRLKQLRSTLRQRMEQSPLMDAPKFARSVEVAYRQMWRKWCEIASERNSKTDHKPIF